MGFAFFSFFHFFFCHKFARLLQRVMLLRVIFKRSRSCFATHEGFDFSVRNVKIINLYSVFFFALLFYLKMNRYL